MPFVIGVMGIGGVKEEKKPGRMKYFRQAQAAPASLPEFKGNVVAVQTAPYWDDDLEALRARMERLWPKVDARVEEEAKNNPKMTGEELQAFKTKVMAENFTPEEWKRLQGRLQRGLPLSRRRQDHGADRQGLCRGDGESSEVARGSL